MYVHTHAYGIAQMKTHISLCSSYTRTHTQLEPSSALNLSFKSMLGLPRNPVNG